jgi:tRNA(Arg) A34 adenosine deaminase TadA
MDAINVLSAKVKNVYDVAPNLELYTSAEPCPMCMSAILWSGFGRVYYGTSIAHLEEQHLDQIDIRAQYVANAATSFRKVEIIGGLLSNETDPLYDQHGFHHDHKYIQHTHD